MSDHEHECAAAIRSYQEQAHIDMDTIGRLRSVLRDKDAEIEQLRELNSALELAFNVLDDKAADEIDRLRAERDEAERALAVADRDFTRAFELLTEDQIRQFFDGRTYVASISKGEA